MPARKRLILVAALLLGAAAAAWLLAPGPDASTRDADAARTSVPDAPASPELSGVAAPPRQGPAAGVGPAPTPAPSQAPSGVPRRGAAPLDPTGFELLRLPGLKPAMMTLRGRLLEGDGTPAVGARVGARPISEGETRLGHSFPVSVMSGRSTDEYGRFELAVEQAAQVEISAWSERSPPIAVTQRVSPADVVDVGDVLLPAGLVLEGRVLVGGRPSPFGPPSLHIWRQEVSTVMGSFERGLVLDGEGRPLSASLIVPCAVDGSWRAQGLSPGTYSITIRHVGGAMLHQALQPAARRSAAAPARNIDFDLPASLLALAPASAELLGSERRRVEVTTSAGTCTQILSLADRGMLSSDISVVPGIGRGDDRLLVPAGEALEVRVQIDGFEGWRARAVAAGPGVVLRLVVTPRVAPKGWIKLRRLAEAQALTPGLRVRLFVPGTDDVVHETTTWLTAPGFVGQVQVPLGTWTAELTPMDAPQASEGELLLPQREQVEVGTSLESAAVLTWAPPQGGRLRLTVEGAEAAGRSVTCTLERAGGASEQLVFRPVIELPGVDRSSSWIFPAPLRVGAPMETGAALAAGGVRLRLVCEGFDPHEEPVVIRAGQTTELTVRLVSR